MTTGLSVAPRAASLSAALHAAIVAALLLASALTREPWPEAAAAAPPRGPMVLEGAPLRVAPRPRLSRRPSTAPPGKLPAAGVPALPEQAPQRSAIEPTDHPADVALGTDAPGGCIAGCVVGIGEPGDAAPGDAFAGGPGTPNVVKVVPGGNIRPPLKVRDKSPVYPELAIRSRAEGRVEIECRIDETGRVVDATVLRGHPLLNPAALDAVRAWVYQPTLLNGVPVSVIMTVTVHFRLRG